MSVSVNQRVHYFTLSNKKVGCSPPINHNLKKDNYTPSYTGLPPIHPKVKKVLWDQGSHLFDQGILAGIYLISVPHPDLKSALAYKLFCDACEVTGKIMGGLLKGKGWNAVEEITLKKQCINLISGLVSLTRQSTKVDQELPKIFTKK